MPLNLQTKLIGKRIIHLDQIDSTNKFIKQHLKSLPNGCVVFTTNQTNGYGSKNRKWLNFKNKNLAISILLKNISQTFLNQSTQFTAVNTIISLQKLQIHNASIKWFNDIIISDKKIAGILGESEISTNGINLILGIGVNILQTQHEFLRNNLNNAGSIFSQTSKIIPIELFLKTFITTFELSFFSFLKNSFPTFNLYNQNCCCFNKQLQILNLTTNSIFSCVATNILPNGNLIVKLPNNKITQLNPSHFSLLY